MYNKSEECGAGLCCRHFGEQKVYFACASDVTDWSCKHATSFETIFDCDQNVAASKVATSFGVIRIVLTLAMTTL